MHKPWFTVEYVHPRIVAIAEFHHFEKVVSYLVLGHKKAMLIDTGMGYAPIGVIIRRITRAPIRVLLTHTHWDHIGGVHEFDSISVFDHPIETELLYRGFWSEQIPELMDAACFDKGWSPKKYRSLGVSQFSTFRDGDVFECAPFSLSVVHTPGHTPGSVCFIINEIDILISGDTLYPGPLYAQLPESNSAAYAASIAKLAARKKSFAKILPGHNATSSDVHLLQDSYDLFQRIMRNKANVCKRGEGECEVFGKNMSVLMPRSAFEAGKGVENRSK